MPTPTPAERVAQEMARLSGNVADAYTACSAKGATMPAAADQDSDHLAATINTITGGGPAPAPAVEKDVNFYDYDGTLLYGYTSQDAAALSALPALPSHTGLTVQAWTHTISSVNAAGTNKRPLNVGCMYNTSDSSTRLYFYFTKGSSPSITVKITLAANSSVTIDWGNGDTSTLENTSSSSVEEEATKSDYGTLLSTTTFCVSISGGSFKAGKNATGSNSFISPAQNLIRVELGTNCTEIVAYAFYNCYSLETISCHESLTVIGNYAFDNCRKLKAFVIPADIRAIAQRVFENCFTISVIIVPDSINTTANGCFNYCYALKSLTLPEGSLIASYMCRGCHNLNNTIVLSYLESSHILSEYAFYDCYKLKKVILINISSINSYAFQNCYSLDEVDLTRYTDPTFIPYLSSSSPLQNIPVNTVFKFASQEMLNAFASATNWSNLANRFIVA